MKLGLQLPYLNFVGGIPGLGEVARAAEDAGYESLWVMDHAFHIPFVPGADHYMLEPYTVLGFLAANTSRVGLGVMATGVTYRHPGMLVKQVSTLSALSGGRAWLGIGTAWYEREHVGLGIPFPPLKERFERLEETLQVAHQVWSENDGAFFGKHYQLAETLDTPRPAVRPRILVAGGGEHQTLRLVAQYADACNLIGDDPQAVRQKLGVLAEHCERAGRDFNAIERTVITALDLGPRGERIGPEVKRLRALAEAGVQTVIGMLMGCNDPRQFSFIKREVIPALRDA